MEMKQGRCRALLLVVAVVATLMLALLTCTTAWANPSGGSSANGDSTNTVSDNKGTADHIDIGISATAELTVAGQSEPLKKDVTLAKSDFTTDAATITATRNGGAFTAFNDKQFGDLKTSTGSSGIEQIRIGGSFPVGTRDNPVVYTVTVTTKVTFNENYKDIPVTLSATFDYWDSANDCPPVVQNKTEWEKGGFISGSGLDFTLEAGSSSMGSLSIQKSVVNETGGTIEIDGSYSFDVYAYDSKATQWTKKATLTVSVRNGIGSSVVYLPYGKYYIEENVSSAEIEGCSFSKVTIDDVTAKDRKSSEFTLDSSSVSMSFRVKNVYASNVTSVTVSKVWDDDDDQDGIRPDSVTVSLLKNGEATDEALTLDANNNWTVTFTDLDRYGSDGSEINYTVKENAVSGYTTTITSDATSGFTITNSHAPETLEVSGTKTWNDANDQDGIRPSSITVNLLADGSKVKDCEVTASSNWAYSFTNLPKYANGKEIVYTVTEGAVADYTTTYSGFDITNTHTPSKTSVTVSKVWDDSDDQDGKRPDSVTVKLLADGKGTNKTVTLGADNGWKATFNDLDEKAAGKSIVYTVEEVAVDGYTSSVGQGTEGGYVITNTYEPATTSVFVTKIWNDNSDQDGVRPESITVNLLANGERVETATIEADETGRWAHSFTNLPKYDNGKEIVYTVTEEAVDGYTAKIEGFSITNTHTPATVDVSGTKTWNDDNDKDGKRPDSIKVNLLADGDVIASVTVTAADNWAYSFANLPKYANGKEIVYTISEDEVEGYTSKTEGYNITNTLVPEDPEPDPQPSTDPDDGDDEGDSDDPKPLPKADSTPKTGDSTPVAPLALIACAAVALAAFALPAARRRK